MSVRVVERERHPIARLLRSRQDSWSGHGFRTYTIYTRPADEEFPRPRSPAPDPAQHQVSAARWIASRKLPNRRRIVFSDGRIAASVQLSAVGSEPYSATNSRIAATDSSIRVSAASDSGTASPSNTPGGFALWELRSTNRIQLSSLRVARRPEQANAKSRDLRE